LFDPLHLIKFRLIAILLLLPHTMPKRQSRKVIQSRAFHIFVVRGATGKSSYEFQEAD
jgi:hypothetical protein